jgi:hypothetical protein
MIIVYATIVNVAIPSIIRDLHTAFPRHHSVARFINRQRTAYERVETKKRGSKHS